MKLMDILSEMISEKMVVKRVNSAEYAKYVAASYEDAPVHDPEADSAYSALNASNHTMWKRLLSRIQVVFTTESEPKSDHVTIAGKQYKVIQSPDPYNSQGEMKADVENNKTLKISLDYSDHPYFSVEDNIVFRTVHDYIVHILGNKQFGLYGELQAYNLHAKLVPESARAAIFTEVVGQVCWYQVHGGFPTQKAAILHGFDYLNVGNVSDEVIKKYSDAEPAKPEAQNHK